MTSGVVPATGAGALTTAVGAPRTTTGGASGTTTGASVSPPTNALTTTSSMNAVAGAAGSGDPYFPDIGNGGYDAAHYELNLTIDPGTGFLSGTSLMGARATQDLACFNLDLIGMQVSVVTLDAVEVAFRRQGQELSVIPAEPIPAGAEFTVAVTYSGTPQPLKDPTGNDLRLGWQHAGSDVYTLDEPVGAATWYPVNDTPADKATYLFHLTVPKPYMAAANGVLLRTTDAGADQIFTWEMDKPMASYLAAVDVGRFQTDQSSGPAGVTLRNYFTPSQVAAAEKAFARTADIMTYFTQIFGPFPFAAYGVVVPDVNVGSAMENQTLSLYGRDVVSKMTANSTIGDIYVSHELAHQWFGDSVTLGQWKDVWLNEGFATYASWLWLEHSQGKTILAAEIDSAYSTLSRSDQPPLADPGIDSLFGPVVYLRGALALHALRLTVGDTTFFAILRAWTDRYRYANVRTEDFVALAQNTAARAGISPTEIPDLFDSWLHGGTLPSLP